MPALIATPNSDPIPASDEGLRAFAVNFSTLWVPATFNTISPTAIAVTAASDAYGVALGLATDPATRTTPLVSAKNAARLAVVVLLRSAIRACQAAYLAGIATEEQLQELGVRPNSVVRTPISAPLFPPVLSIDSIAVGSTNLRVTQVDQSTGLAVDTRGFSYGIIGVELQRKVGSAEFSVVGLRKTVKINDVTEGLATGTSLSYRGRYQTARGLVSPFSPVVAASVLG